MIGIFDSGIGGLSVLKEVRKALPMADIVYYADNANCPYGPKSREFVTGRAEAITETLTGEYGADIIVVACNTATAAAIGHLREKYSDPDGKDTETRVLSLTGGRHRRLRFIGMEPAIKPAAALTKTGTIGVLATAGTLNGRKYADMRKQFCRHTNIIEHIGEGFVETVEKGITEGEEAEAIVAKSLKPMLDAGADTIVLGCTHYPFLEKSIIAAARKYGHEITVINPAPAVTVHLTDVMKDEGIPVLESGKTILLSSGDDIQLKKAFADLL